MVVHSNRPVGQSQITHASVACTHLMMLRHAKRAIAPIAAVCQKQVQCGLFSTLGSAGTPEGTTHFGFQEVAEGDKKQMVGEVFHKVADKYDLMNDLMSGTLHRLWKDEFVRMLGPVASHGKSGCNSVLPRSCLCMDWPSARICWGV